MSGLASETWTQNGTSLLLAQPESGGGFNAHFAELAAMIAGRLPDIGAILLRGFDKGEVAAFHDFVQRFGAALLSYEFASTPRSRVGQGVYSSTEYPAHQWIPQHNEQSYTLRWPMKIWFYCDVAPQTGGATPIADSRLVYHRITPVVRARFAEKGLMYVRNYGNGLDLPWQDVFQTTDRAAVESYCRDQRIQCEWTADGDLRTRQVCQSDARHPITGEAVWFNQAHLFHVSSLEPEIRDALLAVVDESELPRNALYADGSAIEDGVLDEIRAAYAATTLSYAWEPGDLLLLDNMLTSHGRAPFAGSRRILVAMTEAFPNA